MGGDQGQGQQNQITQQQLGVEQQYLGMAQNQLTQEQTLTAPQKTYNTGVINAAESGNYSNLISAAGPATGTIAQTEKQAQEQIMSSVPAGPGRDYALAASKQGEATQMSPRSTSFSKMRFSPIPISGWHRRASAFRKLALG